MAAARFLVRGRVQGVGYRYFALRSASSLGVSGFARNLADGSVEVVAEAADPLLVEFEAALREGPSFCNVEAVERTLIPPRGEQGFYIR